jgi:hypothetical protein
MNTTNKRFIFWAATFSMLALVAHAIDVPDHLREWWGYGTFFVIVAAFQFFYGIALFLQPWRFDEEGWVRENADRYGRPYFILEVVLTASSVVVYAVSRTIGIPLFGADAIAEPVTLLSLLPPLEGLLLMYFHVRLLLGIRGNQNTAKAEPVVRI